MSQPPQYPPGNPPPGGAPPGGWGTPPGPGGPPPGGPGGVPPYGGPPRRNNTALIVIVAVIAVVLVGGGVFLLTQGGDERSEEEQAYVDAITDGVLASQEESDAGFELTEDQARCYSEGIVDTVGIERLRDAATPEEIRNADEEDPLESVDLDLQQAGDFYGRTDGCIDWRNVFMQSIEAGGGLSDEQIDCVGRTLPDDVLRDLLVAQFAEDEDAEEEAGDAADEATESCDLPE
jgi:hypothetical protein